jgi:hypothetical protein
MLFQDWTSNFCRGPQIIPAKILVQIGPLVSGNYQNKNCDKQWWMDRQTTHIRHN